MSSINSYGEYDVSTESHFSRDDEGHTVFYPWKVMGSGRIIPDAATQTRIRHFMNFHHKIFVATLLGLSLLSLPEYWGIMLAAFLGLMAWYMLGIHHLCRNLPSAPAKSLTLEGCIHSAETESLPMLWLWCIGAAFAAISGFFIYQWIGDVPVGIILGTFFGTLTLVTLGMIAFRLSHR